MKQSDQRAISWLMTGIMWLIGIVCFIWGGIKNISSIYGIVLMIALFCPLLISLLLTFRVKIPTIHFFIAVLYLVFVIAASCAYKIQDYFGYILPVILLLFFTFLVLFYALFKTLRHRENGVYYFDDKDDHDKCKGFWDAFKQYYILGLTSGIIEGILTTIFN